MDKITDVDVGVGGLDPATMALASHPGPVIRVLLVIPIRPITLRFPVLRFLLLCVHTPPEQPPFNKLPLHAFQQIVLPPLAIQITPDDTVLAVPEDLRLDLPLGDVLPLVELPDPFRDVPPSHFVVHPFPHIEHGFRFVFQLVGFGETVLGLGGDVDFGGVLEFSLVLFVGEEEVLGGGGEGERGGEVVREEGEEFAVGFAGEHVELVDGLGLEDDALGGVEGGVAAGCAHVGKERFNNNKWNKGEG